MVVEIASNIPIHYAIKLFGKSLGPIVKIEPQELNFGEVDVLKDYCKKLKIINESTIDADFYFLTRNENSIFRPIQKHDILPANNQMEIEIICNADDRENFKDVLHLVIKEGVDKDIQLQAKGIGSTIYCKEDLKMIKFGTQYTHRNHLKEIFIQNNGRRQQKIYWEFKVVQDKNKEEEKKQPRVFQIYPECEVLPPKTGIMFQFRAYSTKRGKIAENFALYSIIENEKKSNLLFFTQIEGDFIMPSLQFSQQKVHFKF